MILLCIAPKHPKIVLASLSRGSVASTAFTMSSQTETDAPLKAGDVVYESGTTRDPWVVLKEPPATPGMVWLAPMRVTAWHLRRDLWYQAFPADLRRWPV